MIVSPDILRRETIALIKQIDAQIEEVEADARKLSIPAWKLRDHTGSFILTPLLLAKAQAYNTLVILQARK